MDRTIRRLLLAGVAVPIFYYGIQALAAPSFPGFRFVETTASELGSDLSSHPALFNAGIMAQGVLALVASAGFLLALPRLGVHPALAALTAFALAMNGVQSIWAGWFPLPDPRHGGHPGFLASMLALPLLLTASLWRLGGRGLRAYLVATLLLLAVMAPLMSGATGVDRHAYRGLLQRVFTLTIFPPIGVAAIVSIRALVRRSNATHASAP